MNNAEDLDLKGIEAFVEVARHGGFRTAAREAKISQPTLSKRLANLERALGNKLFTRGGGEMRLTDYGLRLLPKAQSLLSSAQAMMAPEKFPTGKPLRMGVACSACAGIADKIIMSANQDGYDIDPREGVSTDLIKEIMVGQLDVMLGRYSLEELPTGIHGQMIAADRLGIVCVKGHPLDRANLSISDIGDTPIIGFQKELSPGLESDLVTCWKKARRTWDPVRRASGPMALFALVQAGIGVTVLPERAFSPYENLTFRLIKEPFAISRIIILWSTRDCSVKPDSLLRWALGPESRS